MRQINWVSDTFDKQNDWSAALALIEYAAELPLFAVFLTRVYFSQHKQENDNRGNCPRTILFELS